MRGAMQTLYRTLAVAALLAATPSFFGLLEKSAAAGQELHSPGTLHGVLSRQRLSPLLRNAPRELRFSPDGAYLVVQDESVIYLLSREHLALRKWFFAPDALPARFSSDSKMLVFASRSLQIGRWLIAEDRMADEKDLPAKEGCLVAELSADGELAACYDPGLKIRVFRTDTGEQILAEGDEGPSTPPTMFLPRGSGTAFAEPIGFLTVNSLPPLVERESFWFPLLFSPDGRYLLTRNLAGTALALDLVQRKRVNVPGSVQHHARNLLCFVGSDQIAARDAKKDENSVLLAFPGGATLGKLPLPAAMARSATQQKYLLVQEAGQDDISIVDLETDKVVQKVAGTSADVWNDTLLSYSQDGEVRLAHLGARESLAQGFLPLAPLPTLRTAAVSGDLDEIALGVRGGAGVFRVASGERIVPLPRLYGVWLGGNSEAYVDTTSPEGFLVKKVDEKSGTLSDSWRGPKMEGSGGPLQDSHPAGPVLLFYFQAPFMALRGVGGLVPLGLQSSSELRAMDIRTGAQLWSRKIPHDAAVPFADPQGERVLLAWRAKTGEARSAAKRDPVAERRYKSAKLSDEDTFFEVLDARTGKTLGGALVQSGAGPEHFSSAFSAGDALIVVKDGTRITVVALGSGEERARLFGSCPAASGEAHLLAVCDGGRVMLRDLKTGEKRGEESFPDEIVYTRFSADGKRLLVLSAHQEMFVLDVSEISAAPAAARR
ncbi:MAG: PQQ-like beta-propeller repeat protein [Acidobacteriia bacterium]|nr:PQQ-like beta-propeller repeat protein [Terriglobia bacterium]